MKISPIQNLFKIVLLALMMMVFSNIAMASLESVNEYGPYSIVKIRMTYDVDINDTHHYRVYVDGTVENPAACTSTDSYSLNQLVHNVGETGVLHADLWRMLTLAMTANMQVNLLVSSATCTDNRPRVFGVILTKSSKVR